VLLRTISRGSTEIRCGGRSGCSMPSVFEYFPGHYVAECMSIALCLTLWAEPASRSVPSALPGDT